MGTPRRTSCTTNQSDCASPLLEHVDAGRRQIKPVSGIFAQLSDKKPVISSRNEKEMFFNMIDSRDIVPGAGKQEAFGSS